MSPEAERPRSYNGRHRYTPKHEYEPGHIPNGAEFPLEGTTGDSPDMRSQEALDTPATHAARIATARQELAQIQTIPQPEILDEPVIVTPRTEPIEPPVAGPFAKAKKRWNNFKVEHPRTYRALQIANYTIDMANQLLGHWYAPKPKWPEKLDHKSRHALKRRP